MAKEDFRGLYQALEDADLLEYGSVIPRRIVHEALQIEVPDVATKSVFDQLALFELAAIDYVRNILLGTGKYIAGTQAGYRILLPSENMAQVNSYMSSADKKLSRAMKLSRNTPGQRVKNHEQTEARILLKQTNRRHGQYQHAIHPHQ